MTSRPHCNAAKISRVKKLILPRNLRYKEDMRFTAPLVLILFVLMGCAHTSGNLSGSNEVDVVYSMTAADLLKYEWVGSFTSRGMLTEDECIIDLKSQAAGSGANLIRITSTEHDYCGLAPTPSVPDRACLTMRANGYHRKPSNEE